MAAAGDRRGSDDRRTPVLVAPQAWRVRGEAAVPAHRAGGRVQAGGPGLRPALAGVIALTTSTVAAVLLAPLAVAWGFDVAWWLLTGASAALVLGAVVLGLRLAGRAHASTRSLVHAAAAIGSGDLGARVPLSGPRELAEVAHAFNQMAERLVAARTSERELVADLSHRLRTPLTGLRLDADALDSDDTSVGALSPSELDRRRSIRRIRQAIKTLEGEVDVLITTTRKAVERPAEPGVCDASEVVRERMRFWSALAEDQARPHKVLGAHIRIKVPVPRAELAAALDAVLGNVFRYTPQGTAFEVAVSRRDGYVAVRVDDAGPGIGDPGRALRRGASDQGSTGLGLDIARRAATAASGSVSIDRARLGGASVVMLFADAEATPRQASRFGLVGRLAREPRGPRWPRQRRPVD